MEYHHKQIGTIIIAGVVVGLVFAVFFLWNTQQSGSIRLSVLAILVFVLVLFNSLTVQVKGKEITCGFGPGIIRKTFALADINSVRIVRNPWYAGWGIRWRPGQYVLWSVSGFKAVELELKDGNRFRIGTDEPEALVDAIRIHNTMSI